MGARGLRFANGTILYFRHNRLSIVTVIDTTLTPNRTLGGMCFTYFYAFAFVQLQLKNSWRPYKIVFFLYPFALLRYAMVSFAYQQILSVKIFSSLYSHCYWISSSKVMLVCICKNTSAGSILVEIEKSTILTQFFRIETVKKSIFEK